MKAALRQLIFLTVFTFSFGLLAQKNAPFLIQVSKMELLDVGNTELEYLQIWANSVAISTPVSFPVNSIEGYTFFAVIKNSDGAIFYEGYKAFNGSSNVDSTLISKSSKMLFSIPVELLGALPGNYNVQVELYSMHESGEQKFMIASKAHKLTIPKLDYIGWSITSLKIPDSESYDARFLFAKHISCNADLYVKIHRNNSEIYRSGHLDNSCHLTNEYFNGYTSASATWRISAVDYDGTSFDDLVAAFEIGRVKNAMEKEITSGGSSLSYKVSTSPRPALNPYLYNVRSSTRKHNGITGISYSLRGSSVAKLLSNDFLLTHYVGSDAVTKPILLHQSTDSLVYFLPLQEYEPGAKVRIQFGLDNAFTHREMARYRDVQQHIIPDKIPDCEIKSLTSSYEKIRGTMCLKISGTSVVPDIYLKNGTLSATCEVALHRDSIAINQATSNFSVAFPVHSFSENTTKIPVFIEPFLYTKRENFPSKKRYFLPYTDTLQNIKIELEEISIRVFAKVNKNHAPTAQWRLADCYSTEILSEKKSGAGYTDFTIRKHKDDDLKLILQYESSGQKKEEVLILTSSVLAQKGKKTKLKSLKGAGKIKIVTGKF